MRRDGEATDLSVVCRAVWDMEYAPEANRPSRNSIKSAIRKANRFLEATGAGRRLSRDGDTLRFE
jgi:hypothetical protein